MFTPEGGAVASCRALAAVPISQCSVLLDSNSATARGKTINVIDGQSNLCSIVCNTESMQWPVPYSNLVFYNSGDLCWSQLAFPHQEHNGQFKGSADTADTTARSPVTHKHQHQHRPHCDSADQKQSGLGDSLAVYRGPQGPRPTCLPYKTKITPPTPPDSCPLKALDNMSPTTPQLKVLLSLRLSFLPAWRMLDQSVT